jgi:limonene-1,2-epoxide hydrolase
MVANIGDQQIPLSRGCSVRRYRDGWITWACDVYDTGPFRQPPPPEMVPPGVDPAAAPPLPPVPAVEWPTDAVAAPADTSPATIAAECAEFHPTDSVYHDPFGEIHGREAITAWLTDVMPKIGRMAFDPIGPALDDGTTYVQEWVQVAVVSDDERVPMARGTSVRRRVDGQIVYAADYFDTASFLDPAVQAAGAAAGATLTAADIARHRS